MAHNKQEGLLTRREFLQTAGKMGIVGAGMVLGLAAPPVRAAGFPEKDIKMIITFSAGGGTDFVGRSLVKNAKKYLGVNVAVVNMPGAGGVIGATALSQSRPDGYTIGLFWPGLTSKWLQGVTEYNYSSFDTFMMVNRGPACIGVRTDSKYITAKDLIEDAKTRPGQVSMAISGVGGAWHLAVVSLATKIGANFKYISYQGAAPARAAMLGGHVDSVACGISELYSFYQSKEARILASFSSERHPKFPDVPTLLEQDYDHQYYVWRPVVAPKGLPEDRYDILMEGLTKCYNDPEFIKLMEQRGFGRYYLKGEELEAFIKADMREQIVALREIGLLKRKVDI
jgi:tripartite-type tricarboxylate transporter receptor subunit TctC